MKNDVNQETNKFKNIAFIASDHLDSIEARQKLSKVYGNVPPEDADAIVALGGDGLMLQTLHRFMRSGIPIYGMNRGSVGFLMNEYQDNHLMDRLKNAKISTIHPLRMTVIDNQGLKHEALAINEVSLLRQTYQAAKLEIYVDDKKRLEELICDGILVSTPAGSTAYNLSAGGPVLPINAPMLALTPISPFRPRRWRGALLSNSAKVTIRVLEESKRPVSAVADHTEFRFIQEVAVEEDKDTSLYMMFDPGHSLDERILREQFRY